MKRLFAVKGPGGLVTLKDVPHSMGYNITHPSMDGKLYLETKSQAKQVREMFNGLDEENNEVLDKGYRVCYGPDHWRNQA